VTSQPPPAPGEVKPAGQYLGQLRDLAAYVLVGATAVFLFVALLELIPSGPGDDFGGRVAGSFDNFVNLVTIAFPIAAVLLALLVRPRHPRARLIVLVALVEYAVMAFFGLLFGVLIGLINLAARSGVRAAFEGLLVRLAWLAVFGVAAYAVYLIWRNLFYVPKPKPQPGVYGQPQYGPPGYGPPAHPGFGPPHQGQPHPGQPHPGQPHPGQPLPGQPHPGQPQPGQPQSGPPAQGYPPHQGGQQPGTPPAPSYAPGVYGPGAPSWNQPAATMPTAAPTETQPVPPATGYPTAPATPEATQVVPQSVPPAVDRTEVIRDDHPGGPRD
jgi:hypothetical protein